MILKHDTFGGYFYLLNVNFLINIKEKMPIDIKLLRVEKSDDPEKVKASQENIERVKKSQKDRFADETLVDQVIDLDDQWRKANYQMESL